MEALAGLGVALTGLGAAGLGPALAGLDAGGAVVTGYDGFGAPPNQWVAGDTIVQVHRFAVPGDLADGAYPRELGWYERDTEVRWAVDTGAGQVDRVLLGAISVQGAE